MFEGDTEEKLKMEIQELKEIQEGYKKECERQFKMGYNGSPQNCGPWLVNYRGI